MSTPERLTPERLRESLAATRLPDDPTDVVMPPGSEQWPSDLREALTAQLKPAGVLVPVIEHGHELTVLLTRRSAELKHHASQISFPGGRMEEHDVTVEATALRETHEEVGIAPASVSVVGYLDSMPTITGYAVTPVVGLMTPPVDLSIDTTEVELTFEVPLEFLFDARNAVASVRRYRGHDLPIVEFHYDGHRIWGATAHILLSLKNKLYKTNIYE